MITETLLIPGSTHSLSTLNAQPAQVLFTPDGSKIFVSKFFDPVYQYKNNKSFILPPERIFCIFLEICDNAEVEVM